MIAIEQYETGQQSDLLDAIIGRGREVADEIDADVAAIMDDVRSRGDAAVAEHTKRLDGVDMQPRDFRISAEECTEALDQLDDDLSAAIRAAADNIRRFHEHQKRTSWFVEDGDGVILGKRYAPVDAAGVFVPGSSAPLFSSLLMAAIPAKVAGVERVVVCSPPGWGGSLHPAMLAAAGLVGADEVYGIGGVPAIAALAYGTDTIAPVDVIAGPGNAYVQAAKRSVVGKVGIDMIAGPSEIVVIADESANPAWVAADLLSQAEHGSGHEAAVAVVTDRRIADEVAAEVERQTDALPRQETVRNALERFGAVFVVPDLETACELTNRIAAEHVEVHTKKPWELVDSIRHAGAIFIGGESAEPVGDYFAGTNHILPTGRAARYASSVGVDTFVKSSSVIAYTGKRLAKTGDQIALLAEAEGLTAHARAVTKRLE